MKDEGFAEIGTGLTVFEHDGMVEGPVVWLDSPQAVLDFVASPGVRDTIVLARGGTTTFLTPALSAGVKGVMTLQGAPESHLGILSREYGIPCLMSVSFTEGVASARGEIIPPNGAIVRLDVASVPNGRALIAESDRAYGDAAANAAEPDPAAAAMAEQLAALMAAYRGEIADGTRGNRQLRNRLRSGVLNNTADNVRRDLSAVELDEYAAYTGWNLWDLIKSRQTEGESGLIPRQEYETVAFVQQWATYRHWVETITERIGVDGVIELGAIPTREIGSKANHVRIWALGACPLIGRALASALGQDLGPDPRGNANALVQFQRRLQYGLWGEGPGYVSGRDYLVPALSQEWLTRFRDEEHRLDDPEEMAAFRAFNAATELSGFLLHYDCRAALNDTGPYPLPGGGFVIVRDHFLYETAHEWADGYAGLPYCVTQAMFFRPAQFDREGPVTITINDIATTFAQPKNYLKYLSGVAVYARDTWDTPVSQVRRLDFPEMAAIVARCNAAMLELYKTIAATPWDTRVRNGVKVYAREFLLPFARAIGMWDEMLAADFDAFDPLTEAVYPALTGGGGEAQQALGAVFLMGVGLVPDSGLGSPPEPDFDVQPALHALALRGSLPAVAGAEALEAAELVQKTHSGYLLTKAGRARHQAVLDAERAGLDLDALAPIYERFLSLNGPIKSLSTKAAGVAASELELLADDFAKKVERAGTVLQRTAELLPRFASYEARLNDALSRAEAGDWQYLVSPAVDSVHTVWMELHEDYLQTLGRDRETEGSY
ncbi:MAG: PEP-utilizing enzyme [Sporichthyaceae bacterium]